MFKNRHIQVKFVKDATSEEASTPEFKLPTIDIDKIHAHAKDLLITGGVLTTGVVASSFVLYTLSQIAINNTNPLYKK